MRLQTLDLKDFMSHGETHLDFTGIPAAIITGPNGAGKSTLIDAIGWVVWGETRAGTDDVVRLGQAECSGTVTFSLGGSRYRITRSRRTNGRGSSSLDFETEDALQASGWRSLAGANLRDTQARIEALVGPFDLACATWLSRQGQADQFARATSGERRQILGRLLGLDRWAHLRDSAREMARGETAKAEARDAGRGPLEAVAGTLLDRRAGLSEAQFQMQNTSGRQADAEAALKAASERLAALHLEHADIRDARTRYRAKEEEVAAAEGRRAARARELADARDLIKVLEMADGSWTTDDQAAIDRARQSETEATTALDAARTNGETAKDTERAAAKAVEDAERAVRDANAAAALTWERQVAASTMDLKNAETDLATAERALADAGRAVDDARARAREDWQNRRGEAQAALAAADREVLTAGAAVTDASRAIVDARQLARDAWVKARANANTDVIRANGSRLLAAGALAGARRDASLLDGVPCGGRSEFAGCQFLRNAVEQRDALQHLQADADAAVAAYDAAVAAFDALGTEPPASSSDELAPLQAALVSAQERADAAGEAKARAALVLSDLGTAAPAPADEVLLPLQHRHAEARHVVDAQEEKVRELRQAVAALGTVAPPADPSVLAPLQAAVLAANKSHVLATVDLEALRALYSGTKTILETARAEIQRLETKRANAEASVQKLNEARAKVVAAEQDVARIAEEVSRLTAEWGELKDACRFSRELVLEATAQGERIEEATRSRDAAVRAVAQAETQVRDAERLVAEAEKAAADLATLDAEVAAIRGKAADLTTLAQAYADVPQLVVETVVPDIEETANRLLARVSQTGLSISIRTQRALKSEKDRLAETLDLVVRDSVGERPYETYSGGERFRVDLALRFALAAVLSARAGVPLETIVIDEGFGALDAPGVAAFTSTLTVMAELVGLCLVISHVPEMADALAHRLVVRKGPQGSVATWVD